MSTDNKDAVAELKRLAEAATPGPWVWVNSDNDESWSGGFLRGASLRTVAQFGVNETKIVDGKSYTTWALPKSIIDSECIGGDVESDATAEYLARFDPTTILDLIAAHAAQAGRIKQLEHEIWCAGVNADGAGEELSEARNAALEEAASLCDAERVEFMPQAGENNGRSSDFAFGSVNSAERIAAAIRALRSQPAAALVASARPSAELSATDQDQEDQEDQVWLAMAQAARDGGFVGDATAAQLAAPQGLKLVPLVPTPKMIEAASKADDEGFEDGRSHGASGREIYGAMLAAAPVAQPATPGEVEPKNWRRLAKESAHHLTIWLEDDDCGCDVEGHTCGRPLVQATLHDLNEALAAAPVPAQQSKPTDGMHAAADFIDARAEKYLQENADTETDTGAVIFHYGEAGRDYHSMLVELADDLRAASAVPAPPAGQAGAIHYPYLGKWCYSHNEEDFTGEFDSEQEAIAEARADIDGHFWIGQCVHPADKISAANLGQRIIEWADEAAYEEVGGDDQVFEWSSDDAIAALGQMAIDFIKREASASRYGIANITCHEQDATPSPQGAENNEGVK